MTSVLGILGGTFDPVHEGHLGLAREVRAALDLDAVRLVPAGDPPHRAAPVVTAAHRLAMVEIAVDGDRRLAADPREVLRAGRSYTVLTLEELRREAPTRPLALIVGTDAFAQLTTWHRWLELFDLAHIVVVARPGATFDRPVDAVLPPALAQEWHRRLAVDPAALRAAPAGAIYRQPVTPRPISASAIRAALARRDVAAVAGLLPPAGLAYIDRHRLDLPGQDAT